MKTRWMMPIAAAAIAAFGCGSDEQEEVDPAVEPVAAQLTDAEIMHVATMANDIDVETGQLALQRARDPEVRSFAERMVTEHQAANDTVRQRAVRLGISPVDNEISRALRAQADVERSRLEGVENGAFDREYIEHEVNFHSELLDMIDDVLVPVAAGDEMAGLLGDLRSVIDSHLEHARTLHGRAQQ